MDANPLLSAVIGGKARDVFLADRNVSFYTTAFNFKEVEKYIPVLSVKRSVPAEDLYLALSMLPLCLCEEEFYGTKIKKAYSLIGKRDPDDVHLLALSLELGCPVWSNDSDFKNCGVEVYTTLDLLRFFGG